MKKRVIRIGVLVTVFIVALIGFSYYINQGSADMTVDMGMASMPTISFDSYEFKINRIVGHVKEMDVSAIRDKVTPLDEKGKITGNIENLTQEISKLSYEVYDMEGKSLLQKKELQKKDQFVLTLKDVMKEGEQGIVKLNLQLEKGQNLYYYIRVSNGENLSFEECMKYVKNLHTNILKKEKLDDIKAVMESDSKGDNTTFHKVTINSELEKITWGKLEPEIVGDVNWNVSETKEAYTSVQLRYRVKCQGEHGEEIYNVKEFFRVRNSEGKTYLLTYDRTMEEVFIPSKSVVKSKGIQLGIVSQEIPYRTNEKGTVVAFVQANELWSYNAEDAEFARVFSFAGESGDFRNNYDKHAVQILSMQEDGSATFAVYGYMNRGIHEGETGAAIYYYDLSKNVVEEKAFIPSNQSLAVIQDELGEVAYYNDKEDVLFILSGNQLYKVDMKSKKSTVILESLIAGQYVTSEDGEILAYYEKEDPSQVITMNFATNQNQTIDVTEGEIIRPIGFLGDDFVYGVGKREDIGTMGYGEKTLGMYKLEICNVENEVVKKYDAKDCYILSAKIKEDMITLTRATKQNGIFSLTSEDYITSNEENNQKVFLKSYWTEEKETQFRLEFEEGLESRKVKVLSPQQLLVERKGIMEFEQGEIQQKYYTYGHGEMVGAFTNAGEAIDAAKEVSGIVISPKQRYVWEEGNRVSWYRNFEIDAFSIQSGENSLSASIRAILAYEGKHIDVASEMATKTALQVLEEYSVGEIVCIQGCSSADMRYLIDKGIPVIALTGGDSAIVLMGYDAKTINYINPLNGGTASKTFSAIDEMTAASGNTFFAYMKER